MGLCGNFTVMDFIFHFSSETISVWIDFKLHIPVSKACRSFSHPQSLLSPPKTYSFIPTAAIVAEDLADGTSPPVIILFNV